MSCDAHGAVLQGSSHRQSRAPRRPDTLESRTEQVNEQATHTSGTAAWALHARAMRLAARPAAGVGSARLRLRARSLPHALCGACRGLPMARPPVLPVQMGQRQSSLSCACCRSAITRQSCEIRCRLRCAPQSAASPQSVVARQLYAPLVAQHLGGQRWSAGGVQRRRRSIDTATSPPPCP